MTQGKPTLTKVTIDGIDIVDSLLFWDKEDTFGRDFIKQISITTTKRLEDVIDTSDESLFGKSVVVTRGVNSATEQYIFRGVVINKDQVGIKYVITCADNLYLSKKTKVTRSFDKDIDTEAGVISEICKTLFEDHTSLTVDNTTVQDSGTDIIVNKFICRGESVYELVKQLTDVLGWIFRYDADDDKVYIEPSGYSTNSSTVEVGTNSVTLPKWKSDESNLYNEVQIQGGDVNVQTEESGQIGVTSGYTTEYIQLVYTPISARILVDSSNPPTTERTIGVQGGTTTANYSAYIDKTKKRIVFNADTYTPSSSDYVIVQYTFQRPISTVVRDNDSISKYNNGNDSNGDPIPKSTLLFKDYILEVDDAKNYIDQFLLEHKDPILSTQIKVFDVKDLDVSQKVRVIDDDRNIDQEFYVTRIKQSYPYNFDEITIVSEILDDSNYLVEVYRKLNDLNRRQKQDFEFLIDNEALNNDFYYENRELIIQDRNLESNFDGFKLGHPEYGVLGTSKLGATGLDDLISKQLVCPLNRFVELFYDEDYLQDWTVDTFEDGDYTSDPTWTVDSGTFSVSSTVAKTGTYSLKTTLNTTTANEIYTSYAGSGDYIGSSAWIYPTALLGSTEYCYIMLSSSTTNSKMVAGIKGNRIVCYFVNNSGTTISGTEFTIPITANDWHRVTFGIEKTNTNPKKHFSLIRPDGEQSNAIVIQDATYGTGPTEVDLTSLDRVGIITSTISTGTTDIYFDNIAYNMFYQFPALYNYNLDNTIIYLSSTTIPFTSLPFAYNLDTSTDNFYTKAHITIQGDSLDNATISIGEDDNISITYTEVTMSGTGDSRTGSIDLINTNKYGINFKVESTSGLVKIDKVMIRYETVEDD